MKINTNVQIKPWPIFNKEPLFLNSFISIPEMYLIVLRFITLKSRNWIFFSFKNKLEKHSESADVCQFIPQTVIRLTFKTDAGLNANISWTYWVMLLKDKQTNKLLWKHNLFGIGQTIVQSYIARVDNSGTTWKH